MPHANEQIGPYTLIRQLGRGGFGVVWLAERRGALATTQVAIKLLLDEEPDLTAIAQESQVWAHVGGHPNVLPIIEADIYDGQVVIVSEYAPDGSLEGWLKRNEGKAPSLDVAVSIALGILSGLDHLHNKNIIHRDLKPANILLQGEIPRLADFGLARVLKSSMNNSGAIAGTPAYMSPESFDGKRSEQADLWSVGVIFYQLISGTLPFPAKDTVALLRSIILSDPVPLPNTVPEPIRQVINYSLKKECDERYSSAKDMRQAIKAASSLIPGLTTAPTAPLPQLPLAMLEISLQANNPFEKSPRIPEKSTKPLMESTVSRTNFGNDLARLANDTPNEMLAFEANKVPPGLISLPDISLPSINVLPTLNSMVVEAEAASPEVGGLTFNLVTLLNNGKIKERKSGQVHYFTEELGEGLKMDLVYVPGNTFNMGSAFNETRRDTTEGPVHIVTVPGFYIGQFPITQAEWALVASWPIVYRELSPDPSYYKGRDLPVEQVAWDDVIEFCARLSTYTGRDYRLPTEAEWEYACRAGRSTPFAFGETITTDIVNYNGNFPYGAAPKGVFRNKTTPVGSLGVANPFGIYDLHGNVWEWCQDSWHENYEGAPLDGSAWETGGDTSRRVLRGGSWNHPAHNCRSASRIKSSPTVRSHFYGFRVLVPAAQS